jgi:hypothetical protein
MAAELRRHHVLHSREPSPHVIVDFERLHAEPDSLILRQRNGSQRIERAIPVNRIDLGHG